MEPAYVRVGQYKTPNSLEELTIRRFITFMERAAIVDAFELDYQIGLGSGVSGEIGGGAWGGSAGLFGQNAGDVQDNEGYALAARGHYAFFPDPEDREENSSQVVHLGASARYRNFDNDTFDSQVQYRQRPFFHFTGTRSVDTGTVEDAEGDVWGRAGVRLGHWPVLAAERVREHVPAAQARRGRRQQAVGRLPQRQLFPDRRASQL